MKLFLIYRPWECVGYEETEAVVVRAASEADALAFTRSGKWSLVKPLFRGTSTGRRTAQWTDNALREIPHNPYYMLRFDALALHPDQLRVTELEQDGPPGLILESFQAG